MRKVVQGKSDDNVTRIGIVRNRKQCKKLEGIIYMEHLSMGDIPHLQKVKGIVTPQPISNRSHLSLLLQDMQIPVLQITEDYTPTNEPATVVYADDGGVYLGKMNEAVTTSSTDPKNNTIVMASTIHSLESYANLGYGGTAIRSEFILFSEFGIHPLVFFEQSSASKKLAKKYQQRLEYHLRFALEKFGKVIYRFSDLSTDELLTLQYGDKYEQTEKNPTLGNRGTFRLLNNHRSLLELEINAINNVFKGADDLSVLAAYCRTPAEAQELNKLVRSNLPANVKVGMMIETPSNITFARYLCKYFDFFGVGAGDLFQLTLGFDRDNVAKFPYDKSLLLPEIQRFFENIKGAGKQIYLAAKELYEGTNPNLFSNNYVGLIELPKVR